MDGSSGLAVGTTLPLVDTSHLIALSEKAYNRLRQRLDGITDDEYRWEPAPIVWSVHAGPGGEVRWDFGLMPKDPVPVTTIGWRLVHITDLLIEERCAVLLDVTYEPVELRISFTADEALAELDRAFASWRRVLERADSARLTEPLDGYWSDRGTFALHIIDELIHHAAEVSLLRDLYQARAVDDVRAAALRGDRASLDETAAASLRRREPDLMAVAAASGLWVSVDLLIDLGFDVNAKTSATPLHHAAGLGRIDLVRKLVEAGARTDTIDDTFKATPLSWAQTMSRRLGGPNASGADWQGVIAYLSR
ncbi:MAG: hypothetical protein QOF07_2756 [Bradyrhizobium sp.]|nr:hypothetical protein [Bradyrhizobium sp.]